MILSIGHQSRHYSMSCTHWWQVPVNLSADYVYSTFPQQLVMHSSVLVLSLCLFCSSHIYFWIGCLIWTNLVWWISIDSLSFHLKNSKDPWWHKNVVNQPEQWKTLSGIHLNRMTGICVTGIICDSNILTFEIFETWPVLEIMWTTEIALVWSIGGEFCT